MANERRPQDTADKTPAERARALAEAAEEAEENPRDETVPGGRYVIAGTLVNAEGVAIQETREAGVRRGQRVAPLTVPTGDQPPPDPNESPANPPTNETPPAGE